MASLTKTKTVFGITSPRTLEKIIPEIDLLTSHFSGQKWSGNQDLQAQYYEVLFHSDFYKGETFASDPALAARDRITRAPKALGFIDLEPTIELTKIGKTLLNGKRLNETFTRQLMKFQLPSPYHTQSKKIIFKVKPYLELLRLIKDLGSLSKTEIALYFSQLVNIDKYDDVVSKIKEYRDNSKSYSGSHKMYVAECFEDAVLEIYEDEIQAQNLKTRESEDKSIQKFIKTKSDNMKDYADAFSRYIRATELVTFERRTFRLIISPQKIEEVDFLLSTISRKPNEFTSTKEFKEFLFSPTSITLFGDDKTRIRAKITELGGSVDECQEDLESLKDYFENLRETIRDKNIEEAKQELKNHEELPDILHVFDQIKNRQVPDPPLFLEWNVWRAMVMLNYAKDVIGNFEVDLDGMPLNFAPGQKPDIEIDYGDFGVIVEVTMSSGHTQYKMESESVPRHFGKIKEEYAKEMYCIFVAPKISQGTLAHYFNLNRMNTKLYGGKTKIIPLNLDQFQEFLKIGIELKFNNPSILQSWLEQLWIHNQDCEDEDVWYENIVKTMTAWVS